MRRAAIFAAALALLASACGSAVEPATPALPPPAPGELRAPTEFASIADPDERARATFLEATRVMLHPRCVNCHPSGDSPHQGDRNVLHDPPVFRGPDDQGIPGLRCGACHQDRNVELARVPGAPKWHLAPKVMAWEGRSAADLCNQLKDPARNGGKTLAQIVDHSAHDEIVAWGWAPGHERTKAPGSQAAFGALMAAWVKDGAACPREENRR